jgi:hypothetical protein
MAVPYGGDIIFSRTVRATVGQTIEIPFTGTGWAYLGELASRRGVVYSSRRLDSEGQTFIFRAEEPGTYALKFFKENFIGGYILNDHVQVIVGEAPVSSTGWYNAPIDRGRVVAEPRWPNPFQEAEIRRGSLSTRPPGDAPPITARDIVPIPGMPTAPATQSAQTPTAQPPAAQSPATQTTDTQSSSAAANVPSVPTVPTAPASTQPPAVATPSSPPLTAATLPGEPPSAPQALVSPPPSSSDTPQSEGAATESSEPVSPDVLLQRAKEAFDGGDAAAAIALLDQLKGYYPGGTDELYWYYGQFYEANTPSRNILLSIDYYKRLVNEYPQSSRFNAARSRIAYLERYYINIQ